VYRNGSHEALLIDPVEISRSTYTTILDLGVEITTVLITHPEPYMEHALVTLDKIYSYELFGGVPTVYSHRCRCVETDTILDVSGCRVTAYQTLSHSRMSVLYVIDTYAFTGSIVQAGTLGETPNQFAEALLIANVKDYLLSDGCDRTILPSVGPPSSVRAERECTPLYGESFTAETNG
jgi:glyoxylase-like metal-dependent hydrolase (beta-lactamase superfamily II)